VPTRSPTTLLTVMEVAVGIKPVIKGFAENVFLANCCFQFTLSANGWVKSQGLCEIKQQVANLATCCFILLGANC
jgi:hypothetical protein